MKRDERQQLRLISDDVSEWVQAAATIRAQRGAIANASVAARNTLRARVVEVGDNGKVAWRVLPLHASDVALLQDLARYDGLPPITNTFHQALVRLTTEVTVALHDVRTVTGVQRFFRGNTARDNGYQAAQFLTQFREYFISTGMPETLARLAETKVAEPGNIAVTDALANRAGLTKRLADLGESAQILPASQLAGLPESIAKVRGALEEEARCRAAALNAGTEVRRAETARLVAGMPVERLKEATRDKIRTAPLAEAGLSMVADVLNYRGLQNLPGIGHTSATRIRGAAQTLWQTTYDEMPVRIDIKDRTPQATELLRQLRRWDAVRKTIGGPADLDRAKNFTSLGNALNGQVVCAVALCTPGRTVHEFTESAHAVIRRAQLMSDARGSAQGADSWDDFLARPADYFALLAELGFITEDAETVHGDLSDEIVEAVRALELKTEHLRASLRGYQSFGARFALVQRKVIIGDEMGLGKTVEAIAVLAHLRAKGFHRFLVICPAAVVTNWMREVSSKSTLRAHRLHGLGRFDAAKNWFRNGGVAITTFETLTWLLQQNTMEPGDVNCVIVDEAHYIKNPDALRTRNSLRLLNSSERAVLLTGTPLENRLDEFCNLVSYLQPNLVVDGNELAPRKFRRQVAPAYLRRNQEDVLTELPELVEVDEWLALSHQDTAAYRDAVAVGNFMAMRQAAMTQGSRSTKMQRLSEIVEEAEDNGRRVVVFSYFRGVLDQVARALPGRVFGPLTGSVPAVKRQTMIDQFSAAGHGAVLVAQIVAGGVGLNIQAASVVVLCEPQLKPTTEWQAIARARRMGQLESVQVHRLLSEDGVDQRIRDILARKRELFEEFARISDTAESAPEAYDVSEAELAREIIAAERERLFAQPRPAEAHHVAEPQDDKQGRAKVLPSNESGKHRASAPEDDVIGQPNRQPVSGGHREAVAVDGSLGHNHEPAPAKPSESTPPPESDQLQPYVAFDGSLPAIDTTPLSVIAANVVRIVEAEGPVLGWRLHQVYRKASAGGETHDGFTRTLNRALTLAERRRLIVTDNPLKQQGNKPKTFRLPSQPKVVARQLGPRSLDVVPPAELAHHLAKLVATGRTPSDEEQFQRVQRLLGLRQLTDYDKKILKAARQLATSASKHAQPVTTPRRAMPAPESQEVKSRY